MTRLLAVASLGALLGCGPIQSTGYLIDTEVQIEAARTAGAERYAPYEWTSANLYFEKAKDKAGYSEYEVAVDYAQKASRFANEAKARAVRSSDRP